MYFCANGKYYKADINVITAYDDNRDEFYVDDFDILCGQVNPDAEMMGTVWALDQIFGHTVNEKGYKVLPPYIKAIYGDSITPQRCEEIYSRLAAQGYAINNVSLGVGSFSFMCLENIDNDGTRHFNPYTRDTFGIAIKATYGETADGNPVNIFKNPKALSWKKSQKGCVIVAKDGESYTDEHTYVDAHNPFTENLLELVFADGRMVKEQSLAEIRNRLYPEGF
jgi:nicotinamide phosphoribosyltransferase